VTVRRSKESKRGIVFVDLVKLSAFIRSEQTTATSGARAVCWVAREVLGTKSVWWLWFRQWLIDDAPVWIYALYFRFGERFARWLRTKPRVKGLLYPIFFRIAFGKLCRDGLFKTDEVCAAYCEWRCATDTTIER
jgi:hypothetical protein